MAQTVTIRFYIGAYDGEDELPLNVLSPYERTRFKNELDDFVWFLALFEVKQGSIYEHENFYEMPLTTDRKSEVENLLEVINDKSVWQMPTYIEGDKYHFVKMKWNW